VLVAQLLARVGYAVWQAAECEDGLAHYVVVRLRAARGVGSEKGRELLEKAQSRTFGHLLKELRSSGTLPPHLEPRLERLLEDRNWVVHRAKRESRGVYNDQTRYTALVTRLDEIGAEATSLNSILESELEEFIVRSGVDRGVIDDEAAELLKRWGY
jgi:hypothetical protein